MLFLSIQCMRMEPPRLTDGTLKPLAITSGTRSALAPNLPTVAEAGFPGTETYSWFFVAAPKGTPAAVVSRLDRALNEVLADPAFRSKAQGMGIDIDPNGNVYIADQYNQRIRKIDTAGTITTFAGNRSFTATLVASRADRFLTLTV